MKFSRHTRRGVALVTAVLLFVCQTAFAAAACVHGFDATAAAAEFAPCHEGMDHGAMDHGESAPQASTAHPICDTPKVASQQVQVPVFAIADLPPVALSTCKLPAIKLSSVAPLATGSPYSSPPLTLLHCRLLN